MTDNTRDLVILGGGLVGMTLALAAAKKGMSSHVIDRAQAILDVEQSRLDIH